MGNPDGSNRRVFITVFPRHGVRDSVRVPTVMPAGDLAASRGKETSSAALQSGSVVSVSSSQGQVFGAQISRGITSGIILLKDMAGGPILRLFKNVYPLEILERLEEWLSKLNNEELVWDSTRNPYRLSSWIVAPPCSCRYVYAGQTWQPNKWTENLDILRRYTENALQLNGYFNSAVINAYIGGEGAVGMHADDEDLFGGKLRQQR